MLEIVKLLTLSFLLTADDCLTPIAEKAAEHISQAASQTAKLASGHVRDIVRDASIVVAIQDRREPADTRDLPLDVLLFLLKHLSR